MTAHRGDHGRTSCKNVAAGAQRGAALRPARGAGRPQPQSAGSSADPAALGRSPTWARTGGRPGASQQVWILRDGAPVAVPVVDRRDRRPHDGDRQRGSAARARGADRHAAGRQVSAALADRGPAPGETAASGSPVIELRGVTKVYGAGTAAMQALRGVDLRIDARRVRRGHGAERLGQVARA